MTQLTWDLDNLTVGQQIPADPDLGTPAGEVTAVEYRACKDHGPDGDGAGWLRHCYYCEVSWVTAFEDRAVRAALRNEHLWTPADTRAVAAWAAEFNPGTADQ
jgi:hypothetical protein